MTPSLAGLLPRSQGSESGLLTSQDLDLLTSVLTQEGFDEVVGHREQLGGCNGDQAM